MASTWDGDPNDPGAADYFQPQTAWGGDPNDPNAADYFQPQTAWDNTPKNPVATGYFQPQGAPPEWKPPSNTNPDDPRLNFWLQQPDGSYWHPLSGITSNTLPAGGRAPGVMSVDEWYGIGRENQNAVVEGRQTIPQLQTNQADAEARRPAELAAIEQYNNTAIQNELGQFNQSNFDVASATRAIKEVGEKYGLDVKDMAPYVRDAIVANFGTQGTAHDNKGFTEGSNYKAIAIAVAQQALQMQGKSPAQIAAVASENANYVTEGSKEANARWLETQKDTSFGSTGLGKLVSMGLQSAAGIFGGPIGAGLYGYASSGGDLGKAALAAAGAVLPGALQGVGFSPIAAGATTGGLLSTVSGGNPIIGAIGGAAGTVGSAYLRDLYNGTDLSGAIYTADAGGGGDGSFSVEDVNVGGDNYQNSFDSGAMDNVLTGFSPIDPLFSQTSNISPVSTLTDNYGGATIDPNTGLPLNPHDMPSNQTGTTTVPIDPNNGLPVNPHDSNTAPTTVPTIPGDPTLDQQELPGPGGAGQQLPTGTDPGDGFDPNDPLFDQNIIKSPISPLSDPPSDGSDPNVLNAGNGGIDDGALSQILNNPSNVGFLDWLKGITGITDIAGLLRTLGPAIPGLLGAFASRDQSKALQEIANQQQAAEKARYDDLVARESARFKTLTEREDASIARQRADIQYGRDATSPYRQRLSDLYANPDSFLQSNEVTKPVQQGTDMLMRSLSMQGNPFGSGNALQQGQSYASDQLFGKLGTEKDRLGTLGGMSSLGQSGASIPGITTTLSGNSSAGSNVGTNAGSDTALSAVGSKANILNSLGAAANNIFNPPQTPAQQFDSWKTLSGWGSDIRIKENIVKIGVLHSGLGVYEYDYKPEYKDTWGHGRWIGVMAQEVAKIDPDAVSTHADGYLMVDYGRIKSTVLLGA